LLGVRLEQHRPEVAIIRRRDGSRKWSELGNRDIDGQPERARERARKSQLCVFVFHIGASKNETSLRPSATFPVADAANDECIYTYNGLLFGFCVEASAVLACYAEVHRRGPSTTTH